MPKKPFRGGQKFRPIFSLGMYPVKETGEWLVPFIPGVKPQQDNKTRNRKLELDKSSELAKRLKNGHSSWDNGTQNT